jgi:hypothetical protein
MGKLKSSLRKFYGRHHDLVDRYGISVYEADLSVSVVQYHSELDRTNYDTKGNV